MLYERLAEPIGGRNWALKVPYTEASVFYMRRLPMRKWDAENRRNLFTVMTPQQAMLAIRSLRRLGATPIPDEILGILRTAIGEHEIAMRRLETLDDELAGRGLALFPFQRSGVAWLMTHRNGLLADEMGLGKTIQVLAAIPEGCPVLVICPATIRRNWIREATRWRTDLSCREAGRADLDSGAGVPDVGELVVTNYEAVRDAEILLVPGTALIVDEAHYCKNERAKRTMAVARLAADVMASGGRVYGLSGTPLVTRPPDLWSVLSTLGLSDVAFPCGFWEFFELAGGKRGDFGIEWGQAEQELYDALGSVMVRRLRKEVMQDLPEKSRTFLDIDISVEASKKVDRAVIASGVDCYKTPDFERFSAVRAELARAKIPALLDLVEEYEASGIPLVVFSAHRAPVEAFGHRPGWAFVTGDTAPGKRDEAIQNFQAGGLLGIALVTKVGGLGINLTHASDTVFVDLDLTLALNQQAEDRTCRIGQRNHCRYTYLVARDTVDERVMQILAERSGLIKRIVAPHDAVVDEVRDDAAIALASMVDTLQAGETAYEVCRERALRRISDLGAVYCHRCLAAGAVIELEERQAGNGSKNPGRAYYACSEHGFLCWSEHRDRIQKLFVRTVPLVCRAKSASDIQAVIAALVEVATNVQDPSKRKTAAALIRRLEWNENDSSLIGAIERFLERR